MTEYLLLMGVPLVIIVHHVRVKVFVIALEHFVGVELLILVLLVIELLKLVPVVVVFHFI